MAAKPSRRSSSWTVSSMRQPGGRLALAYCLAAGRGAAHTRSSAQLHAAAKLSFLASTVSPPRRFPVSGPVAGFWSTSPGPCPLPASATATSWWRSGHLVLELLEDHLPVRDVVASEGPLICHAHLLAEASSVRAAGMGRLQTPTRTRLPLCTPAGRDPRMAVGTRSVVANTGFDGKAALLWSGADVVRHLRVRNSLLMSREQLGFPSPAQGRSSE